MTIQLLLKTNVMTPTPTLSGYRNPPLFPLQKNTPTRDPMQFPRDPNPSWVSPILHTTPMPLSNTTTTNNNNTCSVCSSSMHSPCMPTTPPNLLNYRATLSTTPTRHSFSILLRWFRLPGLPKTLCFRH
ncbi:hypothetical protein FGO68_gene106 [Halteria grandinella]|uniref:Uncharacterized protein n=1 Tax=Halteria grandinella TaxID=5974 RepID=A0A8J8NLR4_HALGN|nr:hypothetical protein FGO68_gene106 [Halteria grandinella]